MLPPNTMSSVYSSHSPSFPGHDDLGAELEASLLDLPGQLCARP